ncbi:MAG: undecaprenyl/decaprenyl-phosphate alpha-N-acetylglucosaminyl 1-phosphate transferase, partial [Candidatus Sumerlaeaceae bacterium]|nr:undecaprenyl/decaprenyl-phosphate alpha-N-acetylglucosaminyl 1-phosphate transferase [Candidatus Sumerlaeaceae bacterium]
MMIVENSLLFLGTLLASGVMTFVVRGIMRRAGIMDVPTGDRKTHERPVAYEGGLAMYTAFVCGLVGLAVGVPEFYPESVQFRGLIFGGTFVVLVGVADDLLDLKPWVKLVAQVAAAYIMYHHGFRIEKVSNPLGTEIDFAAFASLAVTVIWYVVLMNGINMVDGLDGLAAGIVGISSLTVAAIAMDLNQPFGLALALITAAVCLGFLPFNLSPATIFMGDAGSLLLGFLL